MSNLIKEIDNYINGIIEMWNAVGLSIGIVKDNEIIFKKGYGVRDIDTKERVESNTAFAIGSASKAFTSAAVAILINKGKIKSWDDKVKDYIPYYKVSDKYAQNNMTIKDLLSMRSGYSSRGWDNMLFHGSHYSMDEIIDKSQYIPFDLKFRDRMRYDNINYMIVGKIIEVVSGMSWHDFIKKEIFNNLEMYDSGSTYEYAINNQNTASPHMYIDGKISKIKWRNINNAAPAGSIVSNVDDMIKWVRFQLSNGTINNNKLIKKEDIEKMQTPHTIIDRELFLTKIIDDVYIPAYGLGWFITELNGINCIGHGGHIDGFSSYVHFVPDHNFGIVILGNADHNLVSQPIIRTITDILCGIEAKYDYNDVFLIYYRDEINNYFEEYNKVLDSCKREKTTESELLQYCGNYTSKIFGTQKIELKDKKLHVERFDWKGELIHMDQDTFISIWEDDPTHPPLKFEFIKEDSTFNKLNVDMFGEFKKKV